MTLSIFLGLLVAFVAGGTLGFLAAALCCAAGRGDE